MTISRILPIQWYVYQDQTIVYTGTSEHNALKADMESRVLPEITGSFLCIHSA